MTYNGTLLQIIQQGSKEMKAISDQVMSEKLAPDKWSKKEILGHLIDSGINNYRRILIAQLKDDLLFDGYDQENWVKLQDYQSRATEEVIDTWVSINQMIAHLVSAIPESKLSKKTKAHRFDQMSMVRLEQGAAADLAYLIWDYIYHVEHHLTQIIEGYVKQNGPYLA